MPTSGARSGTAPSRRDRGAGDGRIGESRITLSCGHVTSAAPLTTGVRTLWACPNGCGLKPRRWAALPIDDDEAAA